MKLLGLLTLIAHVAKSYGHHHDHQFYPYNYDNPEVLNYNPSCYDHHQNYDYNGYHHQPDYNNYNHHNHYNDHHHHHPQLDFNYYGEYAPLPPVPNPPPKPNPPPANNPPPKNNEPPKSNQPSDQIVFPDPEPDLELELEELPKPPKQPPASAQPELNLVEEQPLSPPSQSLAQTKPPAVTETSGLDQLFTSAPDPSQKEKDESSKQKQAISALFPAVQNEERFGDVPLISPRFH